MSEEEKFANPYIICEICGSQVTHRSEIANLPCGHKSGFKSICPSWSPVNGCKCKEQFGYVPHLIREN